MTAVNALRRETVMLDVEVDRRATRKLEVHSYLAPSQGTCTEVV